MDQNHLEVTAVGTLAVDYFALLPSIPNADEKIMAKGFEVHTGGVAGNVLTQLGRLGVRSGWFGKIGDDEAGKLLLDDFQREGIDSSHAEVVKDEYSMFTWIQVNDRGERSITMFPNVLVKLTAEDVVQKHAQYIASSKVLHTEACLLPLKPVVKAMEIAREQDVTIVYDLDVSPSYFVDEAGLATKDEMLRALNLADVIIPCKTAARELINSDNIEQHAGKLLDYGPKVVAITLGEKGCIVLDRNNFVHIPAYKVRVVDTTGAGDAFHGGFIYSVLKGFSLEESGRFANACGAICCTRVGARSMGRMSDVVQLMKKGAKVE